MALTIEDFNNLLDQVVDVTTKIAADVERLWQKLEDSGLTSAEEQEVHDRILAALSALQSLDSRTPEEEEEEEQPED